MEKLLIHACCAPCLSHPLELLSGKSDFKKLKKENILNELIIKKYDTTVYFSNSNISPKAEYDHRLKEVKRLCELYNMPLIIDEYNHADWISYVKGLEQESEGGKRCLKCYHYRLERLFKFAKENNFSKVTASITISPYKKSKTIFNIAKGLMTKYNGIEYLNYDFKKGEGYKKSIELSKKYNLYRQHYCGCEFSKN